jgi:GT2 family glycosyltransferase
VPATAAVTVAVVSWNTRDLLLRCLDSLQPDALSGRVAVIVVDNGSSDGSAQAARDRAPWAEVIEPGTNLGFGRAVNRVAATTNSEWLLAANADVALEPGALDAMLAAGSDRQVGGVAPRLLLPSGESQHSVHPLPTVPFTAAFALGLHRLSPRFAERFCVPGHWDPDRRRDVPWALGACLLLRRAAFDAVGGFDERQWMYAEDIELGWRLRDAGWRMRYEPSARVRHESSAATGAAFGDGQTERFMDATYAMLVRRRGPVRAHATAAIGAAGAAARMAWMAPLSLVSGTWRARFADNRRWLHAHLRGLRPAGELLRDDPT